MQFSDTENYLNSQFLASTRYIFSNIFYTLPKKKFESLPYLGLLIFYQFIRINIQFQYIIEFFEFLILVYSAMQSMVLRIYQLSVKTTFSLSSLDKS